MLIHLPVISMMPGAGVDPAAATTDSTSGHAAQVRLVAVLGEVEARWAAAWDRG
jgi:hypothetical protein